MSTYSTFSTRFSARECVMRVVDNFTAQRALVVEEMSDETVSKRKMILKHRMMLGCSLLAETCTYLDGRNSLNNAPAVSCILATLSDEAATSLARVGSIDPLRRCKRDCWCPTGILAISWRRRCVDVPFLFL